MYSPTNLDLIIEQFPNEEFLVIDHCNDAIIGVDITDMRIVYSSLKIIEILMQDMTEEEAIEYFEFNLANAYVGEKTPLFVYVPADNYRNSISN